MALWWNVHKSLDLFGEGWEVVEAQLGVKFFLGGCRCWRHECGVGTDLLPGNSHVVRLGPFVENGHEAQAI